MSKQLKLLNIEDFKNSIVINIDENINELPLNIISVKNLYIYVYIICELKNM